MKNLDQFLMLQLEKQEGLLKALHQKGCSIRQLVRITGITKAKVEKILS